MAKIDEHIKVMMLKGETGANIKSIDKTATSGLTDTYTVTLTDGTKSNFNVTNGRDGKDGADFDAFEIGGRNLLLKSRTFGDFQNTADVTLSDGVLSFGASGDILYAVQMQGNQSCTAFMRGQKVTISYWVRVRESLAKVDDIAYLGVQLVVTYSNGNRDYINGRFQLTDELATADSKWRKARGTYELKDIDVAQVTVEFYKRRITGAVDFTRPKLEIGTNPSDWTPAPEDKADVSALAGKADVSAIVPKASVESSTTASQAYAAGQYVVVNGILRKVTAAIAKGNTISDSNSTATTVVGELATLVDSVSQQQAAGKYSTSETDTGRTWIDGKKIYRRVVNLGHFSAGETRKSIGFIYDNIVSAVFLSGDSDGATGSQMPLYPNDTYWRVDATMYGTDVVVRIGASYGGCYVTGVFEYTK